MGVRESWRGEEQNSKAHTWWHQSTSENRWSTIRLRKLRRRVRRMPNLHEPKRNWTHQSKWSILDKASRVGEKVQRRKRNVNASEIERGKENCDCERNRLHEKKQAGPRLPKDGNWRGAEQFTEQAIPKRKRLQLQYTLMERKEQHGSKYVQRRWGSQEACKIRGKQQIKEIHDAANARSNRLERSNENADKSG